MMQPRMPSPQAAGAGYPTNEEVLAGGAPPPMGAPQPGMPQPGMDPGMGQPGMDPGMGDMGPNPLVESLRTLAMFVQQLRENGQEEPMAHFIGLIQAIQGGMGEQMPQEPPMAEPMPQGPEMAQPMPGGPEMAGPMPGGPAPGAPMPGQLTQPVAGEAEAVEMAEPGRPRPRPMHRGRREQEKPRVLN